MDAKLIPEKAGFRPRKSCTSQLLNMTEHIEDGYKKRLITGAVFVDSSAAYDTVNHRRLLSKVLDMTGNVHLTDLIRTLLESRRFFVVLNGKKSRWRRQRKDTAGKCTSTDVVQHLHHRPAHTRRHSQLHLCRRRVHRVAGKRLQQHRSVTHVCPEHYDHLLRHEPTKTPKTQVCATIGVKPFTSNSRTRYHSTTAITAFCCLQFIMYLAGCARWAWRH